MKINITISGIPYDVLKQFAEGNNLTPEQYATNIVMAWINNHIDSYYKSKVKEETPDSLKQKFGKIQI